MEEKKKTTNVRKLKYCKTLRNILNNYFCQLLVGKKNVSPLAQTVLLKTEKYLSNV